MSQFLKLDPIKKDYIFINGSPIATDGIEERVYYSLMIPKNNWLYGSSNQGSLLYTLANAKRTSSLEQQFASLAEDAINQQLIQTGYANAQGVKNIATSPNGTSNQIEIVPKANPIQSQFEFVSV